MRSSKGRLVMKYSAVAAAFATLLIASPASAWNSGQGNTAATKTQAKEKTYCLQFGLDTGSRINRVECKTKREWAQLGVDIDELGK